MPNVLKLFLSEYVILLLIGIYFSSFAIILVGFKMLKINRRKDVVIRAAIMHGTYIFLSHAMGVMCISISYLVVKSNKWSLPTLELGIIILVSALISDVVYAATSSYLWNRITIDKKSSRSLTMYGVILATPWYFIIEIL